MIKYLLGADLRDGTATCRGAPEAITLSTLGFATV